MKRRLLNLMTALSVLLCVATVGMWVRSYWMMDTHVWQRPGGKVLWMSSEGGTAVVVWPPMTPQETASHSGGDAETFTFLHFAWITDRYGGKVVRTLVVPYWFPTFACGLLPALRARRTGKARAKVRRLRAGLCPSCGYDFPPGTVAAGVPCRPIKTIAEYWASVQPKATTEVGPLPPAERRKLLEKTWGCL
jgi:hypothetical protein